MRHEVSITVLLIYVGGCTVTPSFPTEEDQRSSFYAHFGSEVRSEIRFDHAVNASVGIFGGAGCSRVFVDGLAFRAKPGNENLTVGVGAVVNNGAAALTALHVVDDRNSLCAVGRGDNHEFRSDVQIVWCSKALDLAVVALTPAANYSFEWAGAPEIGDKVWTIGIAAPSGGEVSAVDAAGQLIDSTLRTRFGDSGSPLLDRNGNLLGINVLASIEGHLRPKVVGTTSTRTPTGLFDNDIENDCATQ